MYTDGRWELGWKPFIQPAPPSGQTMRVLVIGGAGFIGSHVVDSLLAAKHTVAVVDDLSSGRSDNVDPSAQLFVCDITDADSTLYAVAEFKPDAIYHFAAQVSVPVSFENPQLDAAVNILGLINVLSAARALCTPPRLIFASSGGAVYGDALELPCTELTKPNPATPYGIAKLAGENYVELFGRTYGGAYVTLRFANVFGPRQGTSKETGVCAVFARQAVANEPLTVWGDGSQTRDYVFVSDIVAASLAALTLGTGEIVNLGSGIETSTRDLARMTLEIAGKPGEVVYGPGRAGDVARACLDSRKAAEVLGWRARVDIESGLAETIRWYREARSLLV